MDLKTANKLLEEWEQTNPEPTAAEVLKELRFEYEKTVEVYGARVVKYRPHQKQYKTNLEELLSRLAKLKKAGTIVRQSLNIGTQQNLFEQ